MRIAVAALALGLNVALPLGVLGTPALAGQVYRSTVVCDSEAAGTSQISTSVQGPPGIREPFFDVKVRLSRLPALTLTACTVDLQCQNSATPASFDCAAAVKRRTMAFDSGNIFLGTLAVPCLGPVIRAHLDYTGSSVSCASGF